MAVSSHLLGNRSNGSAFISLSASLMWALDFAYNKNRDGHHDIHLYVIDTFKIPSRVWPAHLLLSYLQLPANTERARRNLCHEYLVDNELPAQAILGEMPIRFAGIKFADERLRMLLPQLSELDPRQPLEILSSLESCRRPFRVGLKRSLTPEHIYAAFELAYMLLRHGTGPTAQDRVAFTVMFLTLVPRMQDSGLNQLMYFFEGGYDARRIIDTISAPFGSARRESCQSIAAGSNSCLPLLDYTWKEYLSRSLIAYLWARCSQMGTILAPLHMFSLDFGSAWSICINADVLLLVQKASTRRQSRGV
ncbi:hypothetical protein PMIN01_04306 [Paraphaeosphaeria minitans]|uniref:DUF7587 domain-containing protein n=1 Tax=Paraphaeosphaeria minitans TaxID=565426 RepID=A0A9P6GIZ9_9PLEO|nr:hypothetical protein PMIN01_04306 [Paraphaeosphaeria minitans]